MRAMAWLCYRVGDQILIEKGVVGSVAGLMRGGFNQFAKLQNGRVNVYVLWMVMGLVGLIISAILLLGYE